jgi:predicted Zn-dependent protease
LTGKGEAIAAGDELVIRSFLAERRLQEGAADQAGVGYLDQTRQSSKGMLETFERFAQQEYLTDGSKDPFVRSHPIPTDRLNQLRARVQASPFFATKDTPALQLRHDLMRAKLSGYLEAPHIVNNRYPASDKSMPARYGRAIAKFFRGGQGALEGAVADIDQLIRERPDYPYFYELKGDLLMRGGRVEEAIPHLRKALQLTDNASLIQVQLASALLQGNDLAAAGESIEMLRRAMLVDPEPRGFRLLGTAYYKQGKQPESEASQAQALLLEGRLEEAQTFAKRAKRGLTAKSPLWLKMDDIITAKLSENG